MERSWGRLGEILEGSWGLLGGLGKVLGGLGEVSGAIGEVLRESWGILKIDGFMV